MITIQELLFDVLSNHDFTKASEIIRKEDYKINYNDYLPFMLSGDSDVVKFLGDYGKVDIVYVDTDDDEEDYKNYEKILENIRNNIDFAKAFIYSQTDNVNSVTQIIFDLTDSFEAFKLFYSNYYDYYNSKDLYKLAFHAYASQASGLSFNYIAEKERISPYELAERCIGVFPNSIDDVRSMDLKYNLHLDYTELLENNIGILSGGILNEYVQLGADPSKLDSYSYITAIDYNNTDGLLFLLKHKVPFDKNEIREFIKEHTLDTETLNIIKQYILSPKDIFHNSVKIIKTAVREKKQTYNWEEFCSQKTLNNQEMQNLIHLASLQKVPVGTKREMCYNLAIKQDAVNKKSVSGCMNDSTVLGDSIDDIPKILLFYIGNKKKHHCFNIVELVEQIRKGDVRNPYNREQLPVEAIMKKYKRLQKILVSSKTALTDILFEIKNNKIMDANQIRLLKATNLSGMLKYPVPIDRILKMTDNNLKDIVLFLQENPIFDARRIKNIDSLLDEGLRQLNIEDEHKDVRKVAFEEYLNEVLKN